MGFFGLGKILGSDTVSKAIDSFGNAIDEIVTSDEEREKIKLESQKLQTEINKEEAKSKSIFVAGWRPFIGWICGFAFGFNFIIRPILNYVLLVFYPSVPIMQSLEMGVLSTLLTGMLGFGALRTFEKHKKISRE